MSSFHPSQTGGQCESIDHGKCLVFIPATSTSPGSLPNMLGIPDHLFQKLEATATALL